MTTDPGDLVFDPTCGSGTTAYVAEQWGRRWITCDTSRVALTLAKQRLMTAVFDYYELAHPAEGVGSGFVYKTVPHVTLKSIANNEPPGQETLYDQPKVDGSRVRVTRAVHRRGRARARRPAADRRRASRSRRTPPWPAPARRCARPSGATELLQDRHPRQEQPDDPLQPGGAAAPAPAGSTPTPRACPNERGADR